MKHWTDELREAEEWLNAYFRGKTIYEGHPLEVVGKALKVFPELVKALEMQKKAFADAVYRADGYPRYKLLNDATIAAAKALREAKQIMKEECA